jgi:hypothetical protein
LFTLALSSWREDVVNAGDDDYDIARSPPRRQEFGAHVREALEDFGVTVDYTSSSNSRSVSKAPLAILQDLSTPQLLLVLAARRILARSCHRHRENNTCVSLTMEGMLQEIVQKLYRGNPPPNASPAVLKRAFLDLLDLAVLRPALDHSGSGPFQYYEKTCTVTPDSSSSTSLSWDVRMRLPLHLTLDIHRDILLALELKALTAPTAILEWGKKLN